MKARTAGAALAVALVAATVGPVAAHDHCGRLCERGAPYVDDSRWVNPPDFPDLPDYPHYSDYRRYGGDRPIPAPGGANIFDEFGRWPPVG